MTLEMLVAALWLAQAAPQAVPPQAVPPAEPAAPAPPSPPAPPVPPQAPAPAVPVPAPPPPAPPPPAPAAPFPPPPRLGFQGALALQYAAPVGNVRGDLDLHDLIQVVIELEAQAGVKVSPRWFVGAYLGGGVGAPGKDTVDLCDEFDRSCNARSARAGLLARLDVTPGDAGNLWLGIGAGWQRQRTDVALRTPGGIAVDEAELHGYELRLMAGVDYRATRVFGFGLFGALSVGSFHEVELPGGVTVKDVGHVWLTFGARGVLFP